MEDVLKIVPISRVFRIIDSCTNFHQLRSCEKLADAYTKLVRVKGVINSAEVKKSLNIKIMEKEEELKYIEEFA
jgi:hypothetical protein